MTLEIWKPVVGFEGIYEVSDQARIRRVSPAQGTRPGHIRRTSVDRRGYHRLKLGGKTRWLHRVVAEAFHGPSDLPLVRHLDGDPGNNVPANLAFGTSLDNANDRRRHGRSTTKGALPPSTNCRNGHEYTAENTHLRRNRGCTVPSRECRACLREAGRKRRGRAAALSR